MILERAIVQQVVVGRDGVPVTREYSRPVHVVEMAQRLHRWQQGGTEVCQLCQSDNAVAVRGGKAMCGLCRANAEIRRAGYDDYGLKPTHFRAGREEGLSGLAIVFDSMSVDLGGFTERILPAAVDRTVREGIDVIQLVDHDPAKPIGRLSAGTLQIQKTNRGLANVVPDPPETTAGKDVVQNVKRRDIQGQSFGFTVMPDGDEWDARSDGSIVRTVSDMRVMELSIVTWPAYRQTSIEVSDIGKRQRLEVEQRIRLAR